MITTFVEGDASLILRVASIPLMPPPLNTMSISTTSGRCSSARRIASSAVWTGGATSINPSSNPTTVASASVSTLWSSHNNSDTGCFSAMRQSFLGIRIRRMVPPLAAEPRTASPPSSRAMLRVMNSPRPLPGRSS